MESTKFTFNISNLKSISFDKYDNNFAFIVDGKEYETCRVLADILSPTINKYHYNDETINKIIINTTNKKIENGIDYFQDFLSLASFNEQELDDSHRKMYLEYFLQLGNIEEYLRLQREYFDNLSAENIIDRLNYIYNHKIEMIESQTINNVMNYAAENFESISKEELKKFDIDLLEEIIQSEKLKLKDEDSLLEFILELYENDFKYSVLFEYVIFKNISEKALEKFITEFDINDINSKIWEQICQRLLPQSQTKETIGNERYEEQKEGRIICKEHKEGDEFNGLLHYLTDLTGGNIHDNGTVKITSNSIYNDSILSKNNRWHPKNLVEYNNNEASFYHSRYEPNAFICFEFKDRQVQLSSYSIKSYSDGINGRHLKNWAVEVSNDGSDWKIIDEHSNDGTLNGPRITANFTINNNEENNFYSFVRIRQTGPNWRNDNVMAFYCIEFYGNLRESISKHKK